MIKSKFYSIHILSLIIFLVSVTNSFSQKNAVKQHSQNGVSDILFMSESENIKIEGYLGQKIDKCITNRIKKQDVEHIIAPFRNRNECRHWQTEFWGKWITSAISAYSYTKDTDLKAIIDKAVIDLLKTQSSNGYIGNYSDSCHLECWDLWGRKYTLLGLLAYYDITKKKDVLLAARRLADHLMTEVGPGKTDIISTGWFTGLPSGSILQPIVFLYQRTGDKKCLDFAEYIVQRLEAGRTHIISSSLNGVPVSERYVGGKEWFDHGQKAYEMMSCYEGILELYRITGNKDYLNAALKSTKEIIKSEIMITGTGSSSEKWYKGNSRQHEQAIHMMETCVTTTWMKLCVNLLKLTGDPAYMDEIEKSTYNALLGSMQPDGSTFSKYSSMAGSRELGEGQCNMSINCCIANAPRGFMLLPEIANMKNSKGIFINLYSEARSKITISSGNNISTALNTTYPLGDSVVISIDPDKEENFSVFLRIPAWSKRSSIRINNQTSIIPKSGTYHELKNTWNKGDKIVLKLDMRGRVIYTVAKENKHFALQRGPIVLARDSRLGTTDTDEVLNPVEVQFEDSTGYIKLKEEKDKKSSNWMLFSTNCSISPLLEMNNREPKKVLFCDYSSAGNDWNEANRFRVWIPLLFQP